MFWVVVINGHYRDCQKAALSGFFISLANTIYTLEHLGHLATVADAMIAAVSVRRRISTCIYNRDVLLWCNDNALVRTLH
jgi:hypothetical protein